MFATKLAIGSFRKLSMARSSSRPGAAKAARPNAKLQICVDNRILNVEAEQALQILETSSSAAFLSVY